MKIFWICFAVFILLFILFFPFKISLQTFANFFEKTFAISVYFCGINLVCGKIVKQNNKLYLKNSRGKFKHIKFSTDLNIKLLFKTIDCLINKKNFLYFNFGLKDFCFENAMINGGVASISQIISPILENKKIKCSTTIVDDNKTNLIFANKFSANIIIFKILITLLLYGGKNGKRK